MSTEGRHRGTAQLFYTRDLSLSEQGSLSLAVKIVLASSRLFLLKTCIIVQEDLIQTVVFFLNGIIYT